MSRSEQEFQEAREAARALVEEEISLTRAQGHSWTPYRPFLNWTERVGAFLCCRCNDSGRKVPPKGRAQFVSYCTGLRARIAMCPDCIYPLGSGLIPRPSMIAPAREDDPGMIMAVEGGSD